VEQLEHQALLDQQEARVLLDQREPQEHQELKARRELKVHHSDQQGQVELQVLQVFQL